MKEEGEMPLVVPVVIRVRVWVGMGKLLMGLGVMGGIQHTRDMISSKLPGGLSKCFLFLCFYWLSSFASICKVFFVYCFINLKSVVWPFIIIF
jgi:hypothetical protein